jgi:limonene-1,2-epoxide hydrolase
VTADGSQEFNPREVNVSVELVGFSNASGGGFDLGVDGDEWLVVAGNAQTVEVFRNATTDTGSDASRAVLAYQTEWTMTGSVTPGDGGYSIDARVIDHTLYGQDGSCSEAWTDDTDPEEPVELTSDNFCEYVVNNDDYSRTDSDDIYGFSALFHDIRIQTLTVAQGYSADGSGEPTSVVQDGMDIDLRVGTTLLHANVGHFGSDVNKMVEWGVVFTVTDPAGTETTYNANDCPTGLAPSYTHKLLGTFGGQGTPQEADVFGSACVMLNNDAALSVGEYKFEADLNFLGLWDTTADRLDESVADEKTSNNRKVMTLDVVNNQPTVLSMTMFNTGDLVVTQESPLEFDVLAFDVDCVDGNCLTYTWTIDDVELGMCGGVGAQGAQCTFQILPEHMTNPRVAVSVSDDNGATTTEYMDLIIWNDVTADSTTADSGILVSYALQYSATTPFTITATDADTSGYASMELPGYTGNYDAVAAIDFSPVTSYEASGVLTHGMTFTVPKSLIESGTGVEGSIWFNQGSLYQLVDGTPADSSTDPTMSVFTWDLPVDQNTLTAGTFVLFGGSLEEAMPPSAGIQGFSAAAGEGGTLVMNWDVTAQMSLGERFIMEICDEAQDANCDMAALKDFTSEVKTYTHPGISTTHGTNYTVTVEVCNDAGCNTQIGIGNVIADKEVDGDGMMTNLIAQSSADGSMWTMTWTTTGDVSDISSWRVCYSTNDVATAIEKTGSKCTDVASATATTVDVMQPTFTGTETYYFVGVAVDDLGNDRLASDVPTDVYYKRDADFTNNDDGNGTIGDDVSGDSELPSWTLPAIGGVVVAAIVVGAIIVTRGGGGGDGDKDWDY